MPDKRRAKRLGILTSGGDCPGLNAAIRGVAKAAIGAYGMEVLGLMDGFTGLVENRVMPLTDRELVGLLTLGGTMLGPSRDKPHRMPAADGTLVDMTGAAVETYRRLGLDCLVCIGGGGTAKNALHLMKAGLNVITLPKTIDNDVAETDTTFGHDSAMSIATEAIDRLHTTASSHQRIILVDIMGHNAGWLALGASLAGGADVCLIPEIPYCFSHIVAALEERRTKGRRFSLVSVAEGARPVGSGPADEPAQAEEPPAKARARGKARQKDAEDDPGAAPPPVTAQDCGDLPATTANSMLLAAELGRAVGLETRVTTLGHIQRGGIPSATDRLLATQLGVAAARLISEGTFGVMVAVKAGCMVPVPLEKVAGVKRTIPLDSPMIQTARLIGLCLGD
jgi:ATP-dependent phosphofructokinase / diphosphate-dependent phosphofructokinase